MATGRSVIAMVLLSLMLGQPMVAGMVLVTVYDAGVVAVTSTTPVAEDTKVNPAGDEVNVPITAPPLIVGDGFAPNWQ